jgi:hypothetical protein
MRNKNLFFVFFMVMIGLSSNAQIPRHLPTRGLSAWFPFNGNAGDSSGNNNHGANNGATLTQDRNGKSNAAYNFSNASIQVATPSWTFSPTDSFSYSLWAYQTGGGCLLMSGSGTNGNFISILQSSTTNFQFGTNKQGSPWAWAATSPILNTWTHYVAVYEGSMMTLYQNGLPVGYGSFSQANTNATNLPFYIGKDIGTYFFNGSLDDIAVYSRALSSSEVQSIYQECGNNLASSPPTSITERLGRTVSLVTKATKAGSTYTWQINRGTGYSVISNGGQFSGAGTDSLIVSNLTLANTGNKIRCVVRTNSCADTTAETTLQVLNTQSAPFISSISSVYPNPCQEFITLVSNQSSSFQIIDLNGKICKSGVVYVGENQINVMDLPTGIYAIKSSVGPSLRFFKTTK